MPFVTPSNTPITEICRRVLIPDDPDWIAAFSGALLVLTEAENWENSTGTGIDPELAAEVATVIYTAWLQDDCS